MVEFSISTDYVNELVYNYLLENGYNHTAFTFKSETNNKNYNNFKKNEVSLMRMIYRAKLYEYAGQVSAAIMDYQEEVYGGSAKLMTNLTFEEGIQKLLQNIHDNIRVTFEKSMCESVENFSSEEEKAHQVETIYLTSDVEICVFERKKYDVEFFVKVSSNLLLIFCSNNNVYKIEQTSENEFGVAFLMKLEKITSVLKQCNSDRVFLGTLNGEVLVLNPYSLQLEKLNLNNENENEAVWMMKLEEGFLSVVSIEGSGLVYDLLLNSTKFRFRSERGTVWDMHWVSENILITVDSQSFLNFYEVNGNNKNYEVDVGGDSQVTIIKPVRNVADKISNLNLIILGYLNGQIGVYDTNQNKIISMYDNFHTNEIVAIISVERSEKCYVISLDGRISCIKFMKNELENQASNCAVHMFLKIRIDPPMGVYSAKYVDSMNAIVICSLLGTNVYSLSCSDDVLKQVVCTGREGKIGDFEVLNRWNQEPLFVGALDARNLVFLGLKSVQTLEN